MKSVVPYKDPYKQREYFQKYDKRRNGTAIRKEWARNWLSKDRADNPEKYVEKSRRLRTNNLEKFRQQNREAARRRRERNREAVNAEVQAWRDANPDRQKEIGRRNYLKNPEKFKEAWRKRRALKLNLLGSVSKDIAKILWAKQDGHCNNIVCDVDLVFETEKWHLDHIMPLALGGLHDDRNLQLLCAKCNRRKGSMHPSKFVI